MVKIEHLVIVTGISGAGKSSVLNQLEDLGYTTVDNLPCIVGSVLLKNYSRKVEIRNINKIAFGMDIRSFENIKEYINFIKSIKKFVKNFEIIFLDAENKVLLNRYTLTRRKHPYQEKSLEKCIMLEKENMEPIKELSTMVIDTSFLSTKELCEKILERLKTKNGDMIELTVHLKSFGFKYGVPKDVDTLFDVRFLPNPYYIPELKEKTGNNKEVQEYVLASPEAKEFRDKVLDFLKFLIPNYIKEGKKHFTIGIGCSGGKHRSVTFVNILEKELEKYEKIRVFKTHREEERGHWDKID